MQMLTGICEGCFLCRTILVEKRYGLVETFLAFIDQKVEPGAKTRHTKYRMLTLVDLSATIVIATTSSVSYTCNNYLSWIKKGAIHLVRMHRNPGFCTTPPPPSPTTLQAGANDMRFLFLPLDGPPGEFV
jgi:hypothetical protein